MIKGISHITFIVKDLERASHFFKNIFDAEEIYSSGEKHHSLSKEKYFLINNIWIAVMEGEPLMEKSYNHIAFSVPEFDFDKYMTRISNSNLEIRECRKRTPGEGRSIYFYDYDNHLFEIHTGSLDERLNAYSQT